MDPGARPNMAQLLQESIFDDSGKSKNHTCPIVPISIPQETFTQPLINLSSNGGLQSFSS
jgi:hypothetical protein